VQQPKSLRAHSEEQQMNAGYIASRPIEAGDKSDFDWVTS